MSSNADLGLDKLPLSKFHIKLLILSAAGVFLDGYDLFIISVALLFITPLWITNSLGSPEIVSFYKGLLGASALIGMFVGAATLGHFTDKFGRKAMYVIDLLFFVVFAALSAVSQDIYQLILFRFLLGIGIGADYPISSTYIAEFAPAKYRGRLVASTFTFWGIGALTAAVVGLSMVSFGSDSWRLMLASGVIPAIIVILLRTRIPESPRWLLSKGRSHSAIDIVTSLQEKAGIKPTREKIDFRRSAPEKSRIKDLFSPLYIRRAVFSIVPWFFMDIGVYGINIFLPTLLHGLGFMTNFDRIKGTAILDVFGIIGFIIALTLIDRVGRLKLQTFGFLGMALSLFILALLHSNTLFVLLLMFAIFQLSMNAGPNTTTWIVATELFPTRLRATAQGASAAFSRLGAITGVMFLPIIAQLYGNTVMLMFYSTAAIIGLLVTLLFGEETKNLSLEDASTVFREFSTLIDKLLENMKNAALALYDMILKFDNLQDRQKNIRKLEHENDEVMYMIFRKLNRSFVAPIDIMDVAAIAQAVDDIIDLIDATSSRIVLYEIKANTPEMIALTEILMKAIEELELAVKEIRKIRIGDYQDIIQRCKEVHTLENYADDILETVLRTLFKSKDTIQIIKMKEIYEALERITDKCDDVADVIMDLTVKYS